jgi:hypothetical protein
MTGVHHGTGQHAWNIPADELPQGLKVCQSHVTRLRLKSGYMS